MALQCLDNLIGIRGICDETVPLSGLYVQDLAGLELKSIEAGVNQDQDNAIDLIKQKLNFALNCVKNDYGNHISQNMKNNTIIQNQTVGYRANNLVENIPDPNKWKGYQLQVVQNVNLAFYLDYITLWSKEDYTADVKVFNLITGQILDSFSIPVIGGSPMVYYVQKEYITDGQNLNLAVVQDAGLCTSYRTTLYQTGLFNGFSSIGFPFCANCTPYNFGSGSFYAWARTCEFGKTQQAIYNNMQQPAEAHGMTLSFSLNCTPDGLFCRIAKSLGLPVLNKLGAELCRALTYSKNLNSVVSGYGKDYRELAAYYDNEYNTTLKNVLQGIKLSDGVCYDCMPKVGYGVNVRYPSLNLWGTGNNY